MTASFSNNRNKFRKVLWYGERRRPQVETFIGLNGVSGEIDMQGVVRDRDFYLIPKDIEAGFSYGEYEEDTRTLVGDSLSITFTNTFTSTPIVTAEFSPIGSVTDCNIYVMSVSTTGMTIGTSAWFSGSVLFKAVNSTTYPVRVRRTPLYSESTQALVSAGSSPNTTGVDMTLLYESLTTSLDIFSVSPKDPANSDIWITTGSMGISSAEISVSSDNVNSVNYIALQIL